MISLRMSGRQIWGYGRLREYFDVAGLLANKEAFASFADAHLRFGAIQRYHADVFAAAVKAEKNGESIAVSAGGEYWGCPFGLTVANDETRRKLVEYRLEGEISKALPEEPDILKARLLADQMFRLVSDADLPEKERGTLFYLLAAAYLLAGFTLEEKPLTPKALSAALRGGRTAEAGEGAGRIITLPSDAEGLALAAAKESYRFPLYTQAALSEGERIRTLKLTAAQARNGSRYMDVTLALYRDGESEPAEALTLKPGEFVYVNAVGDRIVKILATSVENEGCRMERRDRSRDALTLILPDGSERGVALTRSKGASSYAPEGGGFLVIQDYRLSAGNYLNRSNYPQLSSLEYRRVVEVRIIGGNYVALQDNGRVYSSSDEWDQLRRLPSLDSLRSPAGTGGSR